MNSYYIVYKNKILTGPLNKADASAKLLQLETVLKNLELQEIPDDTDIKDIQAKKTS